MTKTKNPTIPTTGAGPLARRHSGPVRVLAQLAGDDLLGQLQELLACVGLEVEDDEPGQRLGRRPVARVDPGEDSRGHFNELQGDPYRSQLIITTPKGG